MVGRIIFEYWRTSTKSFRALIELSNENSSDGSVVHSVRQPDVPTEYGNTNSVTRTKAFQNDGDSK